jgi:hypothetical protein
MLHSTFLLPQFCLPFTLSFVFCITTQVHYKGVSKQTIGAVNAEIKLAHIVNTCDLFLLKVIFCVLYPDC